jgi:Ribbon-helix-helix protein, copG family
MARLEELAEARGSTKAAAIRRAIVEATTPKDAPAVPTELEVLELLSTAARGGNVAAMRELLAYHRERRQDRRPDAVDPA